MKYFIVKKGLLKIFCYKDKINISKNLLVNGQLLQCVLKLLTTPIWVLTVLDETKRAT